MGRYIQAHPEVGHFARADGVQKILKSNFQLLIREFTRAVFIFQFDYTLGFLGRLILWLQSPTKLFLAFVIAAPFLLAILRLILFIFSPFSLI